MLLVPQQHEMQVVSNSGTVGTATPWTAVTSGGTTNTYTSPVVEVISAASNIHDSWGIEIILANAGASATASQASVDILIGGATDDVLISSLLCGYTYGASTVRYLFPLHVPKGVRLAARSSSVRVSAPIRVGVHLYSGGIPPWQCGRKVTTYGTKIDNSRGVAITPAASGAAATATQITASTSEDHFAFLIGMQPATDTTITPAGYIATQLGVGAATEDKFGPVYWWAKTTEEYWEFAGPSMPAFNDISSGSRLTIFSSNSGANDAAYDAHIYAVS